MLRNAIAMLCIVASSTALAENWTETEFVGRSVQPLHNLDSFDFYSGTSAVVQQDYLFRLGSSSYFPLIRTMDTSSTVSYSNLLDTVITTYSLGQANQELTDSFCPKQDGTLVEYPQKPISFKVHTGSSVTFKKELLSKSKWKLECVEGEDLFHLKSPDGWIYKYRIAPEGMDENSKKKGYPYRIEDNVGNYLELEIQSNIYNGMKFTSRFESFDLTRDKFKKVNSTESIIEYAYDAALRNFTVTYVGSGRWEYKTLNDNERKICNPFKACVTVRYESNAFSSYWDGPGRKRVTSRTYSIPGIEDYTYTYEYSEKDGRFRVVEDKGDFEVVKYFSKAFFSASDEERVKSFREKPPWNDGLNVETQVIQNGSILNQTLNTFEKSGVLYSENDPTLIFNENNAWSKFNNAVLTKSVEKRWVKNENEANVTWIGTVVTEHHEFDEFLRAEKTTYSYPSTEESNDSNGTTLFDPKTYVTTYADVESVYHLGLVESSKQFGSSYKTVNTYYPNGLLKSSTVNGATTSYIYGDFDELSSTTDPRNFITTFSSYEYGYPKIVHGAEQYSLIRTIEDGFIKTETEWGDRVTTYYFNPFGDLEKVVSPSGNVTEVGYGYLSEGGYEYIVSNADGELKTVFNALGQKSKVIQFAPAISTGEMKHSKIEYGYDIHGNLQYSTIPHSFDQINIDSLKNESKTSVNGIPLRFTSVKGDVSSVYYVGPFEKNITDFRGNIKKVKSEPFSGFGSEVVKEEKYSGPTPNLLSDHKIVTQYYSDGKIWRVSSDKEEFEYTYDSYGHIDLFKSKADGEIDHTHDANGNLIGINRGGRFSASITYDGLNREKVIDFGDPEANVYRTYDDLNRKLSVKKGPLTWYYSFNFDGKISNAELQYDVTIEHPETEIVFSDYRGSSGKWNAPAVGSIRVGRKINDTKTGWSFAYEYNNAGILEAVTYPDNERVSMMSNAFGEASQAEDYVTNARYWPDGSIRSFLYRNGLKAEFNQSETGVLSDIKHGDFWHQAYTIEAGKLVTGIRDLNDPTKSLAMTYDHVYQLKSVYDPDTSAAYEVYSYDKLGNMKWRMGINGDFIYNYSNDTNRLVSVNRNGGPAEFVGYDHDRVAVYGNKYFEYANDGNLNLANQTDGSVYRYLYDGNNRKTITFKDGKIHHVSIYDHRNKLVYEEKPDGFEVGTAELGSDPGRDSNLIYLNDTLVAKRDSEFLIHQVPCDYEPDHQARRTYIKMQNVYLYKNQQNYDFIAGRSNNADVAFYGACKDSPSDTLEHYKDARWSGWSTSSKYEAVHLVKIQQRKKTGNTSNGITAIYYGGWEYDKSQIDRSISRYVTGRRVTRTGTLKFKLRCYKKYDVKIRDEGFAQGDADKVTYWKSGEYLYYKKDWKYFGGGNKYKYNCPSVNVGERVSSDSVPWSAHGTLPKPIYENITWVEK